MKKVFLCLIILTAIAAITITAKYFYYHRTVTIEKYSDNDRDAKIHPDYCGLTIPANIAPLNFAIDEQGEHYHAKIYSGNSKPIEISGRDGNILIPASKWSKLLKANRGQKLSIDVFVKKQDGNWEKFNTISNQIANEDIEGYLVYRQLHPVHDLVNGKMAIYQRNLQNFRQTTILDNGYYREGGCISCHSFCNNSPDKMVLTVRSNAHGNSMLLVEDGKVKKISKRLTYPAWHPSGKMISISLNRIHQVFNSSKKNEVRDAIDIDSMIAYYQNKQRVLKTNIALSKKKRHETYPAWSPDGKYLYFCVSAMLWKSTPEMVMPDRYDESKYDIVRISYDIENDKWGQLETIVTARETGKSCLVPKISYDGRWLLFSMCNYSSFPPFQPSSNLCIIDLEESKKTGKFTWRNMSEINSDKSEGWHSWSSNSKWIAFTSKRNSGQFSRTYFSHINNNGIASKPFVLPQKNPYYYDSLLMTNCLPEFITGPTKITKEILAKAIRSKKHLEINMIDMPMTMATSKANQASSPYGSQD